VGRRDPLISRSAAAAAAFTVALAARGEETVAFPPVEVIGTSPLAGIGTPLNQVPANVQAFGAADLARQRTSVATFLEMNAASASLDTPTGNPYQPDLTFRGFTASSLLGTPQGLSVFQDGVRINEAFADVVNWDLLPRNAVASMQLLPGSNPVFGLNTLGGALTMAMKDGFAFPGGGASVSHGSFGRGELEASGGANDGQRAAFAAFEGSDDRGWREHSASRIRRLYLRGDARGNEDDVSIAGTFADNDLEGTQALPLPMLAKPRQAYTWPDRTGNRLAFVSLNARHAFDEANVVAANLYYRHARFDGLNSNVNGDYGPPGDPFDSSNVASTAKTRSWGGSLQASLLRSTSHASHVIVAGLACDAGVTDFDQRRQPAALSADREVQGVADFDRTTAVGSTNRYLGAYVADTIVLDEGWSVSLSGRYNAARIATRDRSGTAPAIGGDNGFRRFNPAAGATWTAKGGTNLFGGVSQGMRVPSPVELTCSDPNAPCTLPNIFVADPPLKAIRATTYEAGVRARLGERGIFRLAAFRTDLADDIQFVSAGRGAVSSGFFQNVGRTRRQGLEAIARIASGRFAFTAQYSLLDATFRTPFVEHSPANAAADANGDIAVRPGERIALSPRQALRLRGEWTKGPLSLAISALGVGPQYSRGNENNADPAGRVPGHALAAVDASWQPARHWILFARIDNLLDARYTSFGILGVDYFRGAGGAFSVAQAAATNFLSPAMPRTTWLGVEYRFDAAPR
jgi:iron complex outermembrane receptor protein